MARLEQRSFIGGFGSLDNGVAEPAATPDALITAYDIEHDRQGSIKQRPGHVKVAGLESWSTREAPLGAVTSAGATGRVYVRVTYVTAAGETDDTVSNANADSAVAVASMAITVPFHARAVKPVRHDVDENILYFGEDFPAVGATTSGFDDFRVFSRGPFLQDETRLGANPGLRPLYNRLKPLAEAVSSSSWDDTNRALSLDRPIPDLFGPGMSEADRTLDVLFPDQKGLPVLWWNMYLSTDGVNYYYHRSGAGAENGIVVKSTDVNTANTRAPSTRITRTAPTAVVADATRTVPETGATVTAKTGLGGGAYRAWYVWETGREEYVDAPGWSEMKQRLGFIGPERIPRGKQLTWPSSQVLFSVSEDQQFTITLPTFPSGVSKARVYVEQIRAFESGLSGVNEVIDYVGVSGSGGTRMYTPGTTVTGWVNETSLSTNTPAEHRALGGLVPTPSDVAAEGGTSVGYDGYAGRRYQFECEVDFGILATTVAAIELKMKTANTGTAGEAESVNGEIYARLWNDTTQAWVEVRTISLKDLKDGWTILTVAADFTAGMEETDGGVDRIVWAIELLQGPNVRIDYVRHFNYSLTTRTYETGLIELLPLHAYLQAKDVLPESTSVVFDKPITNRAGLPMPLDTTGQWPLTLHSTDQIGDSGGEEFKSDLIAGAADSLFVERAGELQRIYREEGPNWTKVVGNDWRFSNYLNRTFAVNPGRHEGNIMFDGFSAQAMGIADPISLQGSAIPMVAPDPDSTYEGEYYVQYVRKMTTPGRSYVKLSKAVKFTDTFQLDEYDNLTARYRLVGPGPTDPQVTHVRLYRTKKGTGKAFLTREIPIIESDQSESFFSEDGQFVIDFIDSVDDDLLGREADFSTGQPPAARLIEQWGERQFLVPQADGELAYFSRVTQEGSADPEGFDPASFVDVKTRRASTITALSPYGSALLLHTDNGISAVTGVAPNLSVNPLFSDAGAIGPKAWANVDNAQWVMTRRGPCFIYGGDLRLASFKVEGSIKKANLDTDAARKCNCLLYRARGRTQLWFSYARRPGENPDRVLVNDLNVGSGTGEERELWAEWRGLDPYDTVVTDDYSGNEMVVFSDHHGNLHRHDADITDNGMPIEAEVTTKPIDISGYGVSFRPRMIVLKTNGQKGNSVTLEVMKDYQKSAIHPRKFLVDMGVFSAAIWGKFEYGDGTVYGDSTSDALQNSSRVHLGRPMQQIQFRIGTAWADMPPGTPRDNAFELSGYEIFYRPLGLRRSRVLS